MLIMRINLFKSIVISMAVTLWIAQKFEEIFSQYLKSNN